MKDCFVLLLLTFLIFAGCGPRTYTSWYEPGRGQAFGSSNELWLLLEIKRIVAGVPRAYDTPPTLSIGHFQDVLVISEAGVIRHRITTGKDNLDGVSFNPNIGDLFRHEGKLYLFTLESMFTERTVFQWESNRFEKLSEQENELFLKQQKLSGDHGAALKQVRALNEAEGWQLVDEDLWPQRDEFTWNDRTVRVSTEDWTNKFTIRIEFSGQGIEPIELEYPLEIREISREEFKQLSRPETGYPRGKRSN